MSKCFTHVLASAFVLTALSSLGCSSDSSQPVVSAGGALGGAVTALGGATGSGGASTSPAGSGGVATGGTHASGGQTSFQGGAIAEGGRASGGSVTSTGGQAGGGQASGGTGSGGSATGGSNTGGSKLDGGFTTTVGDAAAGGGISTGGSGSGGSATGGSDTGGSKMDGGATGGATAGDASADSRTSTDGSAIGGATTGGHTGTGGVVTGGAQGTGGTNSTGGGLGSSDGKTPITVWMSGDSTMAGSTCSGGGWGDQLGSFFNSNVKVDNRSVAGRSIQTWLYEKNVSSTLANDECPLTATTYSDNWNAMLSASTGMKKGDYLIIEFGINDGDSGCPRHVGPTLFQTYLTTMAKAASDRGTQAIFLTSTSYIQCSGATAVANRGFRAETKAAGTADNVPVIDMSALSAALYTSVGLCPNSSDYTSTTSKVGTFFCDDHTHFEAAGALQIAQTAAKALKDQGIGLASYLK